MTPHRPPSAAERAISMWFTHQVTVMSPPRHNARGMVPSTESSVMASVRAAAQKIIDDDGEEVIAAAELHWPAGGPLPTPGSTLILPAEFGLPGPREIITARRAASGTGLTPEHIEVTIR